jgi:hypothetical protein
MLSEVPDCMIRRNRLSGFDRYGPAWFAIDTNAASDFALYQSSLEEVVYTLASNSTWAVAGGARELLDIVYDDNTNGGQVSNGHVWIYKDGVLSWSTPTAPKYLAGSSYWGWDGASGGRSWAGRIEACTIYGSALTWQDIQAHWTATGLAQ